MLVHVILSYPPCNVPIPHTNLLSHQHSLPKPSLDFLDQSLIALTFAHSYSHDRIIKLSVPQNSNTQYLTTVLSVHVRCIQVSALFYILFHQPPHLDHLPSFAVHFCFLLRHGVRDMAHALSLLRWQLFACKGRHASTTCFYAITGPYSQLRNLYILEVYNLNSAVWITFQCQHM